MAKYEDYPTVVDYDTEPEASDLINDVFKSIQEEILQPVAEAIRSNNELTHSSPTLTQVFGLTHANVVKALNIVDAYKQNIKEAQELDKKEQLLRDSFDEPPF
ncbi:MAG: hypothetical protein Unbinned6224contig1003_25 [Prokaryotic dsDNA virus sp.]|nr:MAG: hypothetical protein Unbinned6224contig1003_25 [Prokaryotic dsDNA virus sp.]|tara:strand:- start:201 stop:509 length:309 start_codon:yes stop_codon:yes gene_type:complete